VAATRGEPGGEEVSSQQAAEFAGTGGRRTRRASWTMSARRDADMRGWDLRVLREAARLELSKAAEPVDPVAIFRTS